MKADDLKSLERTERMMVRWMCGEYLKDRKCSEDLCNLLGINRAADVVRRERLRWFGHLERKSVDDWVSSCRRLVVEGTRGQGRSRKTWEQCVKDDIMRQCSNNSLLQIIIRRNICIAIMFKETSQRNSNLKIRDKTHM